MTGHELLQCEEHPVGHDEGVAGLTTGPRALGTSRETGENGRKEDR
jgi:hypothetical protein